MAAPTLGDLKAEILDDLDRPDLEPQVGRALNRAIRLFQRERFAFNEGVLTIPTVVGQALYATPTLLAIDSAVLTDGASTWELSDCPMARLEGVDQQGQRGQPTWFARFGESVRLFPVPDAVYTVRFTGHVVLDAPATDADTNAWVDEAADLIAAYAKRHLALHVLKDDGLKARMEVALGEAATTLKGLATTRGGTGVVASYGL